MGGVQRGPHNPLLGGGAHSHRLTEPRTLQGARPHGGPVDHDGDGGLRSCPSSLSRPHGEVSSEPPARDWPLPNQSRGLGVGGPPWGQEQGALQEDLQGGRWGREGGGHGAVQAGWSARLGSRARRQRFCPAGASPGHFVPSHCVPRCPHPITTPALPQHRPSHPPPGSPRPPVPLITTPVCLTARGPVTR